MKKNKTKTPVTVEPSYIHYLTFQGSQNIAQHSIESPRTMLTNDELLVVVNKLFGTQGGWALLSHVVVSK